MLNLEKKLQSSKPPKLHQTTRTSLKSYFNNAWKLYDLLFSSIKSDATYLTSPDPLRNPLIFYLGHTAAFYINKLKLAGLIENGVNPSFDHLFAVGVDPNLPQNLEVSAFWPTVDQVRAYRKTIFKIVHNVIDQMEEDQFPIHEKHPYWAVLMTIEHDRIHFETSSMLIRQLDPSLVERPCIWEYAPSNISKPDNEWIEMAAQTIHLGKPKDSNIFGWDNEYGTLEVNVQSFKATKNLISNQEYMQFVIDRGYQIESLWTKEGWDWRERTKTDYPKFWIPDGDTFLYRAMFDELEMPMDWPVEVNAHEAQAYCQWKGDQYRLLSEAEFNLIAQKDQSPDFDPLFSEAYNLDFQYGSPTPVGFMKAGKTSDGFNDIYGNIWDWLQNDFYALPDFEIHPYYKDFSAPYMDNEHGMMAGGSWITTGTGASKYYRLWFRRHFFQHAGFRLATDSNN